MRVHWKNRFLCGGGGGGVHEKPMYRGALRGGMGGW